MEHEDIPELLNIPFTIDTLIGGDYAFLNFLNQPVGIERSEIKNLLQKLRSGELESQLRKCSELYSIMYLLVEGVFDSIDNFLAIYKGGNLGYIRNRIYPTTRYDTTIAMMVRLGDFGIRIIPSPNFISTMQVVRVIYSQGIKPEKDHKLFKELRPVKIPTKLTANPAVPRLLALCDRMPEKVAISLINTYGGIWSVINTDDKELKKTDGMGKTLIDKLKRSVGKE